MKLEKILKICLAKMGEKDIDFTATHTDDEKDTINRLVEAFNIAYTDAVCEYMPLTTAETVKIKDKNIDCTLLAKPMVYATRLTDRNGVKHRFRTMPTTIVTDFDGEGVLEYAYSPERIEIDGEVNDMRWTADILADGTLATYYFSLRAYDVSSVYYDKFVYAISQLKNKGREIVIRERRWGA